MKNRKGIAFSHFRRLYELTVKTPFAVLALVSSFLFTPQAISTICPLSELVQRLRTQGSHVPLRGLEFVAKDSQFAVKIGLRSDSQIFEIQIGNVVYVHAPLAQFSMGSTTDGIRFVPAKITSDSVGVDREIRIDPYSDGEETFRLGVSWVSMELSKKQEAGFAKVGIFSIQHLEQKKLDDGLPHMIARSALVPLKPLSKLGEIKVLKFKRHTAFFGMPSSEMHFQAKDHSDGMLHFQINIDGMQYWGDISRGFPSGPYLLRSNDKQFGKVQVTLFENKAVLTSQLESNPPQILDIYYAVP